MTVAPHTRRLAARLGRSGLLGGMALAGLLSCTGSSASDNSTAPTSPVPAAPVLTTVTVSIGALAITVAQTVTATASALDQNGAVIAPGSVTWSSSAPSIATVDVGGVVTGVAPGQAQIIATAGGKQGRATVTVNAVPVANITVAPAALSVATGATLQLTATTTDAGGNVLTGRIVAWSTSDVTKATVSGSGNRRSPANWAPRRPVRLRSLPPARASRSPSR